MTTEEVITILGRAEGYVGIHYINGVEDPCISPCLLKAIDFAIAALRAQQEAENPKPLTLTELREMDGEPVWVQSPGMPEYGRWAIVEGVDIEQKILWLRADYTCHDYGKVWLAYRHKPKEK